MVKELDVGRAEKLLHQAETASAAFLDALTDEIAIIDGSGTIIAVNEAWKRFGRTDAEDSGEAPGVGLNYLDVCETAIAAGVEDARSALDGLRSVLRKATNQFVMEYEFVTPREHLWFHLTATALAEMPGALVSHRDITGAKRAEEVLRLGGHTDAAGPVRESFLPALVKNLGTALHVRYALLSEILDLKGRRARVMALWDGTGFRETRPSYVLRGLPSDQILAGRSCVFPSGIRRLFPDDHQIQGLDAEGYMAVPLLDSAGVALGHLAIIDTKPIEDVSFAETTMRVFAAQATPELERRRAERQLEQQSMLIANAPDAILGTDSNFILTYWNRAAESTYGWRAVEVLGRDAREVLHTELSDEGRAQVVQIMRETGEFRGEVIHHRKDGSAVIIGATSIPIRDVNGDVIGIVSINRDISEQKELERALEESEHRNRVLLDAIPDMLFTVNARGRILSYTPARGMKPLVPPEQFLGKNAEEILPKDVTQRLTTAVGVSLRTRETQTVEYQLTKEGETVDYEARLVPIGEDEVLGIVRDFTALRRRERGRQALSGARLTRTGEKPCVLAVDRDMRALRLVRRVLEEAGNTVLVTTDPDEAVHLTETEGPDVVLLDIAGFEDQESNVFGELRRLSDAPVIVIGTGDQAEAGAHVLRAGADDYVTRPFAAGELEARVDLALRRYRSARPLPTAPLEFGDLVIDPASRLVTVCGERVALSLTEYKLLLELAEAAGRVLTHDEILERVWGPGYVGQYDVLRAFVRTLRQKLGDDARQPRFLLSERGVGYRLIKH